MYKKIFVPVDNSKYSGYCTGMSLAIAQQFGSAVTGSHVYSANLHDKRFRDMETGLPGHYQQEENLKRTRHVHGSLIGTGLKMISEAYLEHFRKECEAAGIPFAGKIMEGKNCSEVVKEARAGGYDLIVLGILGLGQVNGNLIGSVCERAARKITNDILVVKTGAALHDRVVVAIDGSTYSFSALKKTLILAKRFDLTVEAVSAYDPDFHRRAFQALVNVLTPEAGKMFKFKEQEKLHDEIIDDGLGKIYQGHLDRAVEACRAEGVPVKSTLLAGKAYHEIEKYLEQAPPSLLVVGRFGAHKTDEQDIGNTAENLLRLAPCNVLIAGESEAA